MDEKKMEKLWDEIHKSKELGKNKNSGLKTNKKNFENPKDDTKKINGKIINNNNINNYNKNKNKNKSNNNNNNNSNVNHQNTTNIKSNHFLNREISLTINPKKVIMFALVILILTSVFFMGRWSATPVMTESGKTTYLSGFFSADIKETKELVPMVEELEVNKTNESIVEKSVLEESIVQEVEKPVIIEEKYVTGNYHKVDLTITGTLIDWKKTWGKIMKLDYSIQNRESGTIEPSYLMLNVEGYGDFQKKSLLAKASQNIKENSKVSSTIDIPNGFAYNELAVGDLTSVTLIVSLYDSNDELMDTYTGTFDLTE